MVKTRNCRANRILSLALCIVMLFGLMTPAAGANFDGLSLIGKLFGVSEAYAAEGDVTTWTSSGTCEWGIDPDGCLWVRPTNGVSGTLAHWISPQASPWSGYDTSITSVVIKPGVATETCYMMFAGMSNCTSMDLSNLDTSDAEIMYCMFADCSSLTQLDLRGLNTGSATNMTSMFTRCPSLVSINLSNFDTRNVTSMDGMFYGCTSLKSLNVSNFDTSATTKMSGMFSYCSALETLNMEGFTAAAATSMNSMFSYCSSLTTLDLSSFNTTAATNMGSMFRGCSSLVSLDISHFDTSNVTSMAYMFDDDTALQSITIGSDFSFKGDGTLTGIFAALLPTPSGVTYTGKWVRTSDALEESPMTPAQMRDAGTVTPGTWVWQLKPTTYTMTFDDGSGSPASERYEADEAATLPSTTPTSIGEVFSEWNTAIDGSGTSYDPGDTIPADTYAAGDRVTLYAQWEPYSGPSIAYVYVTNPNTGNLMISAQVDYSDSVNGDYEVAAPTFVGYTPIEVDECTNVATIDSISEATWSATAQDPSAISGTFTAATGEIHIYRVLYSLSGTAFNAVLLLDENAVVPNVTIPYTISAGTGIAAVPGTSLAVLAPSAATGVTGSPTISSATFTSSSTTVNAVDGVTIDAGEKAAVTPVEVDFSNVTFSQPGIFRYLITEPSSGSGLTYDTQLGDTTNGTRYQRVLDVYVIRDANDDYVIGGYVLHEVAGAVNEGASTAADKSTGFVNEYATLNLTVEADAAGNQSSAEKYFAYTVVITNPSGTEFTVSADWSGGSTSPVPGVASSYTAAEMAAANTEEWTSTAAGVLTHTFYLKEGQEVEIDGIPAGATYSVTSAPEDYSPSWEIGALSDDTAGTGNQTLNANTIVSFLMTREGVVPTGVALSILPGVIIMIGGLAALVVMKNRKKEEGADA